MGAIEVHHVPVTVCHSDRSIIFFCSKGYISLILHIAFNANKQVSNIVLRKSRISRDPGIFWLFVYPERNADEEHNQEHACTYYCKATRRGWLPMYTVHVHSTANTCKSEQNRARTGIRKLTDRTFDSLVCKQNKLLRYWRESGYNWEHVLCYRREMRLRSSCLLNSPFRWCKQSIVWQA